MTAKMTLIIDFDSTLVTVETLEEIATVALRGRKDAEAIYHKIKEITDFGMEGRIPIDESIRQRLALLQFDKNLIAKVAGNLKKKISPSFLANKGYLKKNRDSVYIISSGFKELIIPVVRLLGLRDDHIFANTLVLNKKGLVVGIDSKNPLSQPQGKVKVAKTIRRSGPIHVIGDGFTDYEIRSLGAADKFYAFTETVERTSVTQNADVVVRSFDEYLFSNKLPSSTSFPKSKMKVLLLENISSKAAKHFLDEGFQVESVKEALGEDELIKKLKDVSILGIRSKSQVTSKVLASTNKLLAVGAFCIGTDQTNLIAAADQGTCVFNAPYSNTRSVVEMAIGEMIILIRRISEQNMRLHRGMWNKSADGAFEVRGKRLGIIGYGNIGTQLSVLAENLGMEVYFYDIVDKLALGNAKRCKTLHELLKIADVVTVHVDGRKSNANLIGEREFSTMKKGVIFLNLSRGHVVNLDALVASLKSKKVGGAGIDVYPVEPLSNNEKFESELCQFDNVILTPHVGGSTAEAQDAIGEYVSQKLIDYVNTGSSFGSVNFPQIQLPALTKAHRLLHVHENVPGLLAQINGVLASHKINILGQYLKTTDSIGYVITDVDKSYSSSVMGELKSIKNTIRFRVLY